jgi:bacterioferritin
MGDAGTSSEQLNLLNQALARELQVSVQYMLQHAIGAAREFSAPGKTLSARQNKFIASHSPVGFPGATLKKTAVAEMRHAEAIAERVVTLGGEPTTQPAPITIGKSAKEMLANDREEERGAIQLYRQIIDAAGKAGDGATKDLFQSILSDEEKHYRTFSDLLGAD